MTPALRLYRGIEAAAVRFGIKICAEPASNSDEARQIEWSPSDSVGLCGKRQRLYVPRSVHQNPASATIRLCIALVHDLAHLVFWHPQSGVEAPEEWFTPWESQLVASILGSDHEYWASPYTELTCIEQSPSGECYYICDWKHPKTSPWYLEALEVQKRIGCLDAVGHITWQRAAWRGDRAQLERLWMLAPDLGRKAA